MDPETVAYLDRRFGELIAIFDGRFAQIDGRFAQIDNRFAQIDGRFDELKRHFDVVAESLLDKIQLVGEGVRTVDNKLDRFSAETRDEFRKVDRRLLHLTARVGRER